MITPAETLRVLDVGTGSGLVALMLAQRYGEAEIDAIDIDEGAVEQAAENFELSPWKDRLHTYLSKLQDWQGEYDMIVSNPPYFQNSLKNPDKGREMARHTDTLSYEELVVHSRRLLRKGGCLWLILPAEAETEIERIASSMENDDKLVIETVIRVHSKPGKAPKRVILQLRRDHISTIYQPYIANIRDFYIESAYSPRSEEYAELTKDFYL